MKKLMFAMAAVVAGCVFADITSDNVVGYQEVSTPQGYSMRVATFKAITGKYKISDIKVSDQSGEGGHSVQKVNADGTWGTMYYYLTEQGTGYLADGWYLEDQETAVSDTDVIEVGEALFVSAADNVTLTYAGEVLKGKPVVSVSTGYSMVGNPTPSSSVKISAIEVGDQTGEGGHSIQKVNTDGSWGTMYYYLTEQGTGYLADGWYLEDQETPVSDADVLNGGDALFINAASDVTLTFPAAL